MIGNSLKSVVDKDIIIIFATGAMYGNENKLLFANIEWKHCI